MRTIQLPPQEAKETTQAIISISISYINRTAEIGHASGEIVDGRFVPIQSTVVYEQVNFDELMADRPDWSPMKPAGSFRQQDVFAVLDRKQARQRAEKSAPDAKRGKENGK